MRATTARALLVGLLALSASCCPGACWPAGIDPFAAPPPARDAAPRAPRGAAAARDAGPLASYDPGAAAAPVAADDTPADERAVAAQPARASLAAAPSWASSSASRFSGDEVLAPQPASADDLFRAARRPFQGDVLESGLVLCRVHVLKKFDTFSAADLLVELTLGKHPKVRLWGPEDHDVWTFGVPTVTLRQGETVLLKAWDRDVWSNELIGTVRERFAGDFPLTLESKHQTTECRVVDRAALGPLVGGAAQAIDRLLPAVERTVKPAPDRDGWGYPFAAVAQARRALTSAAALAGWAEPRVSARVQRLEQWEARWRAALAPTVARAAAALPPAGTRVALTRALSARVVKVRCGGEVPAKLRHGGDGCLVEL
ncbi:MAG TPA: hypothetical protein VGQ83_03235, partial [Polyangia bacterium]